MVGKKNRFPFPMNDVQIIYANLTFPRGLLDSQLALSDNAKKSSEKYVEENVKNNFNN